MWDLQQQKVIQAANPGAHSGALDVPFIHEHGVRRALVDAPGTHAVRRAEDDGGGVFTPHQVPPENGLPISVDMLLSYDHRLMLLTNRFGNTVQQFDVSDPFRPVLTATAAVPHPNMLRLSRDNRRPYVVSGSLHTPRGNDATFGPRATTATEPGCSMPATTVASRRCTPTAAPGRTSPRCRRSTARGRPCRT